MEIVNENSVCRNFIARKMERGNKKKVYHSILEIEKEFFPKFHEEKIKEKRRNDPKTFGSDLAKEFLESIRRQLSSEQD